MATESDDPFFVLEGPDADGLLYACSPKGRDVWCQCLGPWEQAAEQMSYWLGQMDYDEIEAKRLTV